MLSPLFRGEHGRTARAPWSRPVQILESLLLRQWHRTQSLENFPTPIRNSEGGLAHLCITTAEAAPRFAVFEAWAPRTMVSGDLSSLQLDLRLLVARLGSADQQMEMFRHHDITHHHEMIAPPRLLQHPSENLVLQVGVPVAGMRQ